MQISNLATISPIDGRYAEQLSQLTPIFSEYAMMHLRIFIEIEWLKTLAQEPNIKELEPFSPQALKELENILNKFNEQEALYIKQLERKINHDVKVIEYYLKEKFAKNEHLKPYKEFIHFAATSDDINNIVYALSINEARQQEILPRLDDIITKLRELAHQYADTAMLARTHGQPATPTTLGKEFANFAFRLSAQFEMLAEAPICGKFNGAVGNLNAHCVAYPEIDWLRVVQQFVEHFNLIWNPYTTQIEPHDYLAIVFHNLIRLHNILIALCRDIWNYISLNYLQQKMQVNEVGSSTMPHKINPIDFENAEGNLGIANALLDHLANKLPISRWQRDLSDSTAMRNIGVALAHSILAYNSILKGLKKIEVAEANLTADLNQHWEVLGEALQTVMRRFGTVDAYEQLKTLTRGKKITQQKLHAFIAKLDIPATAKQRLLKLTPENYLGMATELAKLV